VRMWNLIIRLDLQRKARRLRCLIIGHDIQFVHRLEGPEYCRWCWYTEGEVPLDEPTLPGLLNRAYCWLVERDWAWFEKLDLWLINKHSRKLPNWWSY